MPHITINRIPEELFYEVLVFWASIDKEAPWMASMVCKYWRHVIISCPKAWTNISLFLKYIPPPAPQQWCVEEDDLERAASPRGKPRPYDVWLQRSANLPLTVSVFANVLHPDANKELTRWMGALGSASPRIHHLKIDMDSVHFIAVICDIFGRGLTKLQSIWLTCRPENEWRFVAGMFGGDHLMDYPNFDQFWDCFSNLCDVRQIVLRGCTISAPPVSSPLAKLITHYDTNGVLMSPDHVLTLPTVCTGLTTLRLDPLLWPPLPERLSISLLSLHTLTLCNADMNTATHLLQVFDAPNLTRFSLDSGGEISIKGSIGGGTKTYDLYSNMGSAFKDFVTRSSKIRKLHLANTFFPDRHLTEVVQHLDHLQRLSFEGTCTGTPFLRALARSYPRFLCPRLQHLKFVHCSLVQMEHIKPLLCARDASQTATSILRLTLNHCEEIRGERLGVLKVASPRTAVQFTPSVAVEEVDEEDEVEEEQVEVMVQDGVDVLTPSFQSCPRVRFAKPTEIDDW